MRLIFCLTLLLGLGLSTSYADQGHHHMQMGEEKISGKHTGICPVMGGQTSPEYSSKYRGKTYNFCCPMCIEEFKKDPEKYIAKIKEIKFEAYQFGFAPQKIVVKKGDTVKLLVSSRDVPHGIYIKGYNINVPVQSGDTKKIEFIAEQPGKFEIACSVYCGPGHHKMKAVLIVEE